MCTPLSQNASLTKERFCEVAKKVISRTPNERLRKKWKNWKSGRTRIVRYLHVSRSNNNKNRFWAPHFYEVKLSVKSELYGIYKLLFNPRGTLTTTIII